MQESCDWHTSCSAVLPDSSSMLVLSWLLALLGLASFSPGCHVIRQLWTSVPGNLREKWNIQRAGKLKMSVPSIVVYVERASWQGRSMHNAQDVRKADGRSRQGCTEQWLAPSLCAYFFICFYLSAYPLKVRNSRKMASSIAISPPISPDTLFSKWDKT